MAEESGKLDTQSNSESVQLTELQSLNDRLDALWISYLNTLDLYQQAQAQLQKHLSSGFFSLAQANRSAQAGRRYGRDWYDDRMRASWRVRLSPPHGDGKGGSSYDIEGNESTGYTVPRLAIVSMTNTILDRNKAGATDNITADDEKAVPVQQPSPPATPSSETFKTQAAEPSRTDDKTGAERSVNDSDGAEKRAKRARAAKASQAASEASQAACQDTLRDPLVWFGILVPPALRQAQNHFVAAAGDPVAEAVNAARGLRAMELEIRKVRKALRKAEREMA